MTSRFAFSLSEQAIRAVIDADDVERRELLRLFETLCHWNVGGLAQDFALGYAQAGGQGVEADDFSRAESGMALTAIPVDPRHVVVLLPGRFDQVAEKGLIVFG